MGPVPIRPDLTFAPVSRTSHTSNVRLRDLTAIMLETGELPS